MVSLQERAKALETKYVYEQGLMFRAQSRRNKLIGLWAGEKLGHAEPHDYAIQLAQWAVVHQSDESLIEKLQHDFDFASVEIDVCQLTTRMQELLIEILDEMRA
jgi:hypothetical protein